MAIENYLTLTYPIDVVKKELYILRARMEAEGFQRRTEENDIEEYEEYSETDFEDYEDDEFDNNEIESDVEENNFEEDDDESFSEYNEENDDE